MSNIKPNIEKIERLQRLFEILDCTLESIVCEHEHPFEILQNPIWIQIMSDIEDRYNDGKRWLQSQHDILKPEDNITEE